MVAVDFRLSIKSALVIPGIASVGIYAFIFLERAHVLAFLSDFTDKQTVPVFLPVYWSVSNSMGSSCWIGGRRLATDDRFWFLRNIY